MAVSWTEKLPLAVTAGVVVGKIAVGAVTAEVAVGDIAVGVEVEIDPGVEPASVSTGMEEVVEDCWLVPEHPFTKKMIKMQIPISFLVVVELIFSSHETRLYRIFRRI